MKIRSHLVQSSTGKSGARFAAFGAIVSIAFAACATTGTGASVTTASSEGTRNVAHGIHASRPVAFVATALDCIAGVASSADCTHIAERASVTTARLAAAEPAAVDQVGETALEMAHAANFIEPDTDALVRWLDLGANAIREARLARTAALCGADGACEQTVGGFASLPVTEPSGAHPAFEAYRHLTQLAQVLPDEGPLAPEAEATLLSVVHDRIESASQARPESRAAAFESARAILHEIDPDVRLDEESASGANAAAEAHGSTTRTPAWVSSANDAIAARARRIATQIAAPGLVSAIGALVTATPDAARAEPTSASR